MENRLLAKISESCDDYWQPMKKLNPVLHKMRTWGVKEARVEFYGSGDSGQIEDVTFDKDVPSACTVKVEVTKRNHIWVEETQSYKYEIKIEQEDKPLGDALEHVTYELLDGCGVDWYNNDGGGGHLIVDLKGDSPNVEFHVYYNVIESHIGYEAVVGIEL